ncbi:MAG: hypothetical protein QMD04_01320 [Anaerolineales bacterium]|nr:hypothetical protein [Anaerolineales bacterium]
MIDKKFLDANIIGSKFIELNRAVTWAESPEEWNPAVQDTENFLSVIEGMLLEQKIDTFWSNKDFARLFGILLTILAEAGQYRHEAFVVNPESESDITRRKIIDQDMTPTMAKLRRKTAEIAKLYLSQPIFKSLQEFIGDEIFPLLGDMDDSAPDRYMPFRVTHVGNIIERLFAFKVRIQDTRLTGDKTKPGLLQEIYNFKYLRFGTSGVRGLWQRDFTEKRAKQVVQAICEYLADNEVPAYLHAENLSGRKIIIGYDSRLNAEKVAGWAAQVCLANQFTVFLAARDTPTPALVYWLTEHHREDQVAGLINLTASHNPPEWQGVKFNPRQGWPAPTSVTDFIASRINEINIADRSVPEMELEDARKNCRLQGFDPIDHYTYWVLSSGVNDQRIQINPERIRKFFTGKKVVVDEMHGAGRGYLTRLLGEIGVQYTVIHAERDPLLTGLDYANPEEPYINALKDKVKDTGAAIGLGMDTDADRFGIVDQGGVYFRPNQILPILVKYLGVDRGYRGRVIATQTGSPLLEILAGKIPGNEEYKPEAGIIPAYIDHPFYRRRVGKREDQTYQYTFMVPVGIKYIEEQRRTDRRYRNLSRLPDDWRYSILIGGEESSGLTTKGHVTDKDGIWANLLILDMLSYYGSRPEKPLPTIKDIWEDTTTLSGCWNSFGGRENFQDQNPNSNTGRMDIDAVLEIKENLINFYLDSYEPGKENTLGGFEVIFAGGVRYDLVELRLRDNRGDNRHFLRIRASGTEPINRIYIESSDPSIARRMAQAVLSSLEELTIRHIQNAASEWIITEALAYANLSPTIMKAVKDKLAKQPAWSKKSLAAKIQMLIDSETLEKRIVVKAQGWINVLTK